MLFTFNMSKKTIYIYTTIIIFLFLGWFFSMSDKKNEDFSEHVKVSLREVGHQLLLSNNDSTTVVLPIKALSKSKYILSFENELSFLPNHLVAIVKESFDKAQLPEQYRVSVLQKSGGEVAYSYEMNSNEENTIIPCSGRHLPENNYVIEVSFLEVKANTFYNQLFLFALLLVLLLFLLQLIKTKKPKPKTSQKVGGKFLAIGSFKFYPEQNKLVKAAHEIGLSRKECELLTIFIEKPNEIIKRDELIKRVWEDNGVIVGRSLDTFISKLRKKLKEDDSIKLTNIHGVGYKLELDY
ncbi:MAG: transcriptional regulator [Lutibacter sp.]|nr:MAG: transcriptional regulator [Lutibacter sp.]